MLLMRHMLHWSHWPYLQVNSIWWRADRASVVQAPAHATYSCPCACRATGAEGEPQNVWDSIKELKVKRIQHGMTCIHDPELITYLEDTQLPLDVAPISNQRVRATSAAFLTA